MVSANSRSVLAICISKDKFSKPVVKSEDKVSKSAAKSTREDEWVGTIAACGEDCAITVVKILASGSLQISHILQVRQWMIRQSIHGGHREQKSKSRRHLMKSSAVWPQIRALVWGWCGGQGCTYISPNLSAWEYISPNLNAWQYILPNSSASAYISPYRSVWETECVQRGYWSTCDTCPTCQICASNVVWMRRCCPTCPFFNMVHVIFHWEYPYTKM